MNYAICHPEEQYPSARRRTSEILRPLRVVRMMIALFTMFFIGGTPISYAYTDEVAAKKEAVWLAAKTAMERYGIKEDDERRGKLVSNWIEDKVKRKTGLLSRFVPKEVKRRYRLEVLLRPKSYSTEVEVKGYFQIQPVSSRPQAKWDLYKPGRDEYQTERLFFMSVLRELEKTGPHLAV